MAPAPTVCRGHPAGLRREAAAILYRAFRSKLGRLLGPRYVAIPFLASSFAPHAVLSAYSRGELVGVMGLKTRGWSFFSPTLSTAVHAYGPLRGLLVLLALRAGAEHPGPGEMLIDKLAVRPDARQNGLGALMLSAARTVARREGCEVLRLSVVNTNPAARRLYERHGFQPDRTIRMRIPDMMSWAGFTAYTIMVKRI